MKRAWRLRAQGGRYYAEYTTDDGDTWTATPPGGLGSATAAAQLVVEMKRKEELEGSELTEEEQAALTAKFSDREDELHDDMFNEDAQREERRLEWGRYLVEKGIVSDGQWAEGEEDAGHLPGELAS